MHDQDSSRNLGTAFEENQEGGGNDGGMRQKSREAASSMKEKARETRNKVTEKGKEKIQNARERSMAYADEQKSHLGERIHGYGSAVRRAAEKLREEKDPNIAHYADSIADGLEGAANYVQSRDPGMMLRDAENAIRRRPEVFFGGMFVAGLILSRFLKASTQRDDDYSSDSQDDYWVEDEYDEEVAADGGIPVEGYRPGSEDAGGDWKATNLQ